MTKYLILLLIFSFFFLLIEKPEAIDPRHSWWQIQSIDVMKYSRDIAREKLKDKSFDRTIDEQVRNISQTGATHIAIGTPYDEEFIPFLKRWVSTARKYDLNVWFRGNFSGWEKWFGYTSINREEHIQKTKDFIERNPELFEDGDLFTSCTECENGGPGDPRRTGDITGHRKFLIEEYQAAKNAFNKIGKNVMANTYSMNGDVASIIMDRPTTKALDGVVVIDHYVRSPDKLLKDIKNYALNSGGKIILGEFGAPIPDIHGNLSETDQAQYLAETLEKLTSEKNLIGLNYWVSVGGSTQLWNPDGTKRMAADVVTSYYSPKIIKGKIINELKQPIIGASVSISSQSITTDKNGNFSLFYSNHGKSLKIEASGYYSITLDPNNINQDPIIMSKKDPDLIYKFLKNLYKLLGW
ncbi:hypothetical protein HYW54_02135 [Candidatus Gottesmanbacteria bacterium]|nr:hypothetical protein [Candidatus Gottesmanbacteria bacterium]